MCRRPSKPEAHKSLYCLSERPFRKHPFLRKRCWPNHYKFVRQKNIPLDMPLKVKPKQIKHSKYRSYDFSALSDAFIAVKDEHMSVCKAAKPFGVPHQTLRDQVKGKVTIDCVASGTQLILSEYEEAKVVKHIKIVVNCGYGCTRQEVYDIASDYAVKLGKIQSDKPLNLNWFHRFIERWPALRVLKPRSLEVQRDKCTTADVVDSYFKGLKQTMTKYNLLDIPHLIFNVDEKGVIQNYYLIVY